MKNLADFKRKLKEYFDQQKTIHTYNTHYGDMGNRTLSKLQSNSFAFKTPSGRDNGVQLYVNSWCEFQKASNYVFDNNIVYVFWGEGEKREHILTYTFL